MMYVYLGDVAMYIWIGLQSNIWHGHDTITTIGSLVVKGFIKQNICVHVCIVGDYSTHLNRTGITVWLGSVIQY